MFGILTGCFWRALPEHGFGKKGSLCKGGKKAKQRFMIALIANAAGGKESAIVIWKAEKPRCFKGVDVSKLPVKYFSQANAWMTGEILDEVLTKLNHCLSSCSRSIVLLLDNAGCHPHDLKGKYSNIRIIFLPPNTTSQIQPLDLGIIQNFKVHYRKLLLRFVLSKIDETNDTASQIIKSISVLMAIRWVAEAWDSVQEEMIRKCFTKSGITGSSFSVVRRLKIPLMMLKLRKNSMTFSIESLPQKPTAQLKSTSTGRVMFLFACSMTMTGKITSLPSLVPPHKQSRTHLSKRILMMKKDSLT